MVVLQGLRLALVGISIGIPTAIALTRVTVSVIFGIQNSDPVVLGAVALLLSGIALLAA